MCSCLIMSKLFFLFRIRGKLITVSIKLWLYTLNLKKKDHIYVDIYKTGWASSGVRPKPHPATELEFQVSFIEAGSVGSQLMHKWDSVNLKTWKTPIRVLFSATQCKSKPFTLQHLPTHLKKNTEWMSPVSTITLITENSFWQNADGKNKKHEKWVTSYVSTVLLFLSVWSTAQTLKPEREVGRRLC